MEFVYTGLQIRRKGFNGMGKKIYALILTLSMLIVSVFSGQAYAAEEIQCSINNSAKSIEVSNLKSYGTSTGVSVSFGLTNSGILDESVSVEIAVLNSDNIKKGGASLQMDIKSGKTMPVSFSGSVPQEDAYTIDVNISSYDEDIMLYLSPSGDDTIDGSEDAPLKTVSAAAQRIKYINLNNNKDNLNIRVIL